MSDVRMRADPAAATRLLAWVRAYADETGEEVDPGVLRWFSPQGLGFLSDLLEAAREQLGERFEGEWQAGSRLTREEAVALALEEE